MAFGGIDRGAGFTNAELSRKYPKLFQEEKMKDKCEGCGKSLPASFVTLFGYKCLACCKRAGK